METITKNQIISHSGLEEYFAPFREKTLGVNQTFNGPFGEKRIIYADWIASGRLYGPIERKMSQDIGRYVANTHTETSYTGMVMTKAYHEAKHLIKKHVNASFQRCDYPNRNRHDRCSIKIPKNAGTESTGAIS